MAYTGNDKQEVIGLIEKNNRGEYFQVSRIIPERGLESVDIRLMYTNNNDEIKPTQKGVRVNSETVGELVSTIIKALKPEELAEVMETMQLESDDLLEENDDSEEE